MSNILGPMSFRNVPLSVARGAAVICEKQMEEGLLN